MNGTPGSTGSVIFRALLGDPVVAKLAALTDRLEAADGTIAPVCDAVAAFEAALFAHTTIWSDYLSNAVLETETVCVRQAAAVPAPLFCRLHWTTSWPFCSSCAA